MFEAYHRETARRCWHSHPTEDEAQECTESIGEILDGSAKGWYVRGCSEWRKLGSIRVLGKELRKLLDRYHVKSWEEPSPSGDEADASLRIEPMAWDNPRFVRLREAAEWKKPGNPDHQWHPPPFAISMSINVDYGRITGHVEGGAS